MSTDKRSKTILIASDHNGNEARDHLRTVLVRAGWTVADLGPRTDQPSISTRKVDYVDYATQVGYAIQRQPEKLLGILICGTGIGMSIAANRFSQVRASLVHDVVGAEKTREHNNSNVLVLGSWSNSRDEMEEIVDVWLGKEFGKERHEKRVARLKPPGDEVVLVPGVFDIFHVGHLELVRYAKTLGRVVVAVNSDASVERVKGKKPVNSQEDRMHILRSLANVDEVILMDEDNAGELILKTNAKYIVKGAGVTEEFVRGNDHVPEWCEVKVLPYDHSHTSAKIREAIRGG